MTGYILTTLINKLFQYDEYEFIDKIMNVAFNFLPDDASKYWLKINQYLSVRFFLNKCYSFSMKSLKVDQSNLTTWPKID